MLGYANPKNKKIKIGKHTHNLVQNTEQMKNMLNPLLHHFQKPQWPYILKSFISSQLLSSNQYLRPEHQHTPSLSPWTRLELVYSHEFNTKLLLTCFATSLRQATPRSKLGKTTEPYFWYSGRGRIFIVTSVTTPRVPSGKERKAQL